MALDFSLITDHPYAAGAVIVGGGLGLYLVLRKPAAAADSSGGAYRVGPSDAVQASAIQAGTQLQLAQASLISQNNLAQVALASKVTETQGNIDIAALAAQVAIHTADVGAKTAQDQFLTQLAALQITGQTSISLAGIDANVKNTATAAQVQQAQIASATSITNTVNALTSQQNIAQIAAKVQSQTISSQQTVSLAQINAQLAALRDANATSLGITKTTVAGDVQKNLQNNQTQIGIAGIQAGTAQALTNAQLQAYLALQTTNQAAIAGTVAINDSQVQAYLAAIGSDERVKASVVSLLGSGLFNKGGEGGANQVSVVGGVLGQPSIGTAAQQEQASGGLLGRIFGGAGAVLAGTIGTATQALFGPAPVTTAPATTSGGYSGRISL